jgi:hypothetical protein
MQMEAWTLLYIVEDNKDGDGSMDSVRQREHIICTYTGSKDQEGANPMIHLR